MDKKEFLNWCNACLDMTLFNLAYTARENVEAISKVEATITTHDPQLAILLKKKYDGAMQADIAIRDYLQARLESK